MQRLNFTLDEATTALLDELATKYYVGNKSQTVRAALQSLATHIGHEGWVVAGYSPAVLEATVACHTCGTAHKRGELLYRPTFERGRGPGVLPALPTENWLDCSRCIEEGRH